MNSHKIEVFWIMTDHLQQSINYLYDLNIISFWSRTITFKKNYNCPKIHVNIS